MQRLLHVTRMLKAAAGQQAQARLLLHGKQHGCWW
jgi:hypothetical protein